MPTRAPRHCTTPGCPGTRTIRSGKCPDCLARARTSNDQRRGTPHQRGYGQQHRNQFRSGVLERDPVCVLCHTAASVVADHHPLDRKQLVAAGLDPNDPQHGRGLCQPCDRTDKAARQPGGWHQHTTENRPQKIQEPEPQDRRTRLA